MVTLLFSNLIYNVVVIIKYAYDRWKLYFIRRKNIIEHRGKRKDREKVNKKTFSRQLRLRKLLERENKKTWQKQWDEMLEREAGYEKQQRAGLEYFIVEDYYIDLYEVKTEQVKKSLFQHEPIAIEPVAEEEKEEPPTE